MHILSQKGSISLVVGTLQVKYKKVIKCEFAKNIESF